MVPCVKIVAQVKLLPGSAYDADAMAATLRACNRAANRASEVAHAKGLKRRNVLQKEVYFSLKADFDLGAQPAVRVVKKVCDAYATLKGNIKAGNLGPPGSKRRERAQVRPIVFREDAAQPFDDRILTWNLDARTVSIWTVAGRIKHIPFVCSDQAMRLLTSRRGESDLVLRDGMFFLIATVEAPEPEPEEPDGFLGVDLGIVNIATTSDGEILAGRRLNRYRRRHRDLRAKLQKKRTKSAKRALKRIRRREARHAADANHVIANGWWRPLNAPLAGSPWKTSQGSGRGSRPRRTSGPHCTRGRSPSSVGSWSTRHAGRASRWSSSTPATPRASARSAGTPTVRTE